MDEMGCCAPVFVTFQVPTVTVGRPLFVEKVMSEGVTFTLVCKIAKSDLALSCLSVRLSTWNISAPTCQIFVKLYIWVFFQNLLRKFKFP